MRRFSFIITILLLTLVSCAESGIKEYRNDYQVAPERLTATFEGVESTRIELQELNSVWSAGDEVSVFYRSYSNLKYKFDGNSGDSAGTLSLVAGEQGEATLDKSYMLYPYSENNSLGEDGMLYTSLLAEQSYKANSYGVGGNILVAESTTSQFVLNNVCGWIRIQLTGNGEVVHSITLSSNKDEALAGDVAVNSSDAGYTLTSSGGSSITLDCGEGVTLSESVTEFYIGILPQRLEGGITVDIVTDQDSVSKSTYEAVVVERNHILPMTAFRLSGEEAVYNELRYTATALVEPYDTSAFNVSIVSNEWDEATGEGVITFDGELTTIGDFAFEWCTSLTSVTIPDSVTAIGYRAFVSCNSLTSVTIPDSVTTIGSYTFAYCDDLTSVTIGDSVTTIGEYAFYGCSSLTSVTIGNSVTTIGGGVFGGCSNLAEFKGKFAENGGRCLIKDNTIIAYAEASGTTYTIPDSVTTIGDWLFDGCDNLTSIIIPDSVTTIGVAAFRYCNNLTSVTIPDSVTTIGTEVFSYCYWLTSVTIGDGVTTIGEYAFYGCESLTSVYCEATTPPALSYGAFYYLPDACKIYVPAESFNYYLAAEGWDDLADHLVAYDYENNTEVEVAISYISLSYVDRVVCASGAYQYSPRILGEWGKDVTAVRYTVVEGFVDNVDEYITTDPEQGFDVNGNTDVYIIPELASGRYTMIAISYTGELDNLQRGSVASVQFMIQANDGDEVALDLSLNVGSIADLTENPDYETEFPSSEVMGIYIATPEAKYIAEGYIDFYIKEHDGEELTHEQIDGYLAGKRFEIIQGGWIDSIQRVGVTGIDSICVMLKVTTIFGTNHYYHIDYDVPKAECALAAETYTISDNGYAMSVTISPYTSLNDCRVEIKIHDDAVEGYTYSAICSVDSERGEIVGNIDYIGIFRYFYGETGEKALYAYSRDSQGSEVVNAPIRFSFDADGYLTSINTYFEAYAEQYDGSPIGTYPDTIEEVLYITPNAVITRASSASKASYSARTSTPLKVERFGKM